MQLTAKLTQLHPIQTGTGKNGQWIKQDIIVETDGHYPKKFAFQSGERRSMKHNCK